MTTVTLIALMTLCARGSVDCLEYRTTERSPNMATCETVSRVVNSDIHGLRSPPTRTSLFSFCAKVGADETKP